MWEIVRQESFFVLFPKDDGLPNKFLVLDDSDQIIPRPNVGRMYDICYSHRLDYRFTIHSTSRKPFSRVIRNYEGETEDTWVCWFQKFIPAARTDGFINHYHFATKELADAVKLRCILK